MVNTRLIVHVVGDNGAGKTTAIMTHSLGRYPPEKVPPVYRGDLHPGLTSKGTPLLLELVDTVGASASRPPHHHDNLPNLHGNLLPKSITYSHVIVLCFDVSDPYRRHFNMLSDVWFADLSVRCPGVPIILTGTKIDLRRENDNSVTEDEARALAEKHNSVYAEISSLRGLGLDHLFTKVADVGYRRCVDRNKRTRRCLML